MYNPFKRSQIWYNYRRLSKLRLHMTSQIAVHSGTVSGRIDCLTLFYLLLYYVILYCLTLFCLIWYYLILYCLTLFYLILYYVILYCLTLFCLIMLDLFDKTVVPVLLYGCEVWGYENNIVVDMVFLKFCKYLLGLKSSTPNCMVYGELGSYPVSLTIKIRLISFWLKLISTPDDRISKQMYNLIYRMHQNNTHQSAWLNCITDFGTEWFWLCVAGSRSKY